MKRLIIKTITAETMQLLFYSSDLVMMLFVVFGLVFITNTFKLVTLISVCNR